MTNFNERTNTLLYKNISLTLYSRKDWCWLCVRGGLETGTDCYIFTQVLQTIAAVLSHLGWGCSSVGHWGLKALCLPLALTSVSCPQLTPTDSGTWLYNCLTYTCFRCSSAYLHRCIPWLMARLRVNTLQPSCFATFSVLWQDPSICCSFHVLLFSFNVSLERIIIIIIIIIIWFLVLFSFSHNPSHGLCPRPCAREVSNYMHLSFLLPLLGWYYFQSHL